MIRYGLMAAALVLAGLASADEQVMVCHGYGCLVQETVVYSEARLDQIRRQLLAAGSAAEERERLALAIGQLYAWAGEQTDIRNDKGGNLADDYVSGRMDCIDHSTTTTRLLRLLEARGALRWHRVREPEVRNFALIFPAHYAAVIETIDEGVSGRGGERFVVDSWFVDNGQPAVILPLDDWKKGAGPDV
ncbi:MAG: hypothetical protein LBE81_12940 [Azonexus sp.]|uniref:hypothetical protein n=1 Tax=Azonexus sp. TaxID=1872668 RepID=UPI00281C4EF1|nr:hypothetical protein [Azonexus sp.]MDR0777521.1 hypothetical protein [Azonexus sp.]